MLAWDAPGSPGWRVRQGGSPEEEAQPAEGPGTTQGGRRQDSCPMGWVWDFTGNAARPDPKPVPGQAGSRSPDEAHRGAGQRSGWGRGAWLCIQGGSQTPGTVFSLIPAEELWQELMSSRC